MIYVDSSSVALAFITLLFIFFFYLPYQTKKTRKDSFKKLKSDVENGKKSLELIDYPLLDKDDIQKALSQNYDIRFYDSSRGEKPIYKD